MNPDTPQVVRSRCNAGTTWTLEEEAEDLAREIEAMKPDGPGWVSDGQQPHFLGHLDFEEKKAFIEHLRAGRLRAAIGMVANNAFRCGVRDGPALLSSGRAKVVRRPKKMDTVEYLPQRVSPYVGAILSYAMHQKVMRAELVGVLKKGGKIKLWGMRQEVEINPMSMRDINECLALWPFKDGRGRKPPARQ
jgi:hypothetical protein